MLLFYTVDTLTLCLRISGPASLWTTRSPATGVLLLSPVPFPMPNPTKVDCPCSFISWCGFAVHMGQQHTFACSPAQGVHIYTGLPAQPPGWSQRHKQSLQKPALNLCLAEHISNPLSQLSPQPVGGKCHRASTDPTTLHSTTCLFFPAHQPHSLMHHLPKGPRSSRLVLETASVGKALPAICSSVHLFPSPSILWGQDNIC